MLKNKFKVQEPRISYNQAALRKSSPEAVHLWLVLKDAGCNE